MFGKTSVRVALLVMATASANSHAQTIYNDGGTHTVNGMSGPIILEGNGTTLNVVSPASIIGSSTVFGIQGDAGTAINLFGGQVTGPVGIVTSGDFFASGGYVYGMPNAYYGGRGGWGAEFNGSAQVNGGTFQGGNGVNQGGNGAAFASPTGSPVQITGGSFEGGNAGTQYGIGGIGVIFAGTGSTQISGGTFQGGKLGNRRRRGVF